MGIHCYYAEVSDIVFDNIRIEDISGDNYLIFGIQDLYGTEIIKWAIYEILLFQISNI